MEGFNLQTCTVSLESWHCWSKLHSSKQPSSTRHPALFKPIERDLVSVPLRAQNAKILRYPTIYHEICFAYYVMILTHLAEFEALPSFKMQWCCPVLTSQNKIHSSQQQQPPENHWYFKRTRKYTKRKVFLHLREACQDSNIVLWVVKTGRFMCQFCVWFI